MDCHVLDSVYWLLRCIKCGFMGTFGFGVLGSQGVFDGSALGIKSISFASHNELADLNLFQFKCSILFSRIRQ